MPTDPHLSTAASSRMMGWAWLALLLAVFATYANSGSGPFVYDDKPSIPLNPTIRHLSSSWDALVPPPGGITVSGRPVLNLSFACDYAIGGLGVQTYHVTNVAIHALAALALFGLVRRTLELPLLRGRIASSTAARALALVIALIWALHPLQTEAVTYLVQRAESLMGLFYLVTLYSILRASEPGASRWWSFTAIGTCALGMATKENMVSAPLIALFFDRTFVAGTLAEAWRRRRGLYLGLAATWLVLAALLLANGINRAGSMGFAVSGAPWWDYVLTQFPALTRYLALSFWPKGLIFDYGPILGEGIAHPLTVGSDRAIGQVGLEAVVVGVLAVATVVALWRRPAAGFLGAWFFAILAPTSLLPAKVQFVAEHRMYLPLAAVVTSVVLTVHFWAGWRRSVAVFGGVAVALALLTARRNEDYRDEVTLWSDTVAKRPDNARAHANLASALADAHRLDESITQNRLALSLEPDLAPALATLGSALAESGRLDLALPSLERASQLEPTNAQICLDLGLVLDLLGHSAEALSHYQDAVRLSPLLDPAQNALGDLLCRTGHNAEGIPHLEEAVRLNPASAEAHFNLSSALAQTGRLGEATDHFEAGFRLHPHDPAPVSKWANALFAAGRSAEALAQHEMVVRDWPGFTDGHFNYGVALNTLGQVEAASLEFAAVVRLQPNDVEAQSLLGRALLALQRPAEALPHFEAAVRLADDNPSAHDNLGVALIQLGRMAEAERQFDAAVQLAPDFQPARDHLAAARAQRPPR